MTSVWSKIEALPPTQSPLDCTVYPIEDQTVLSVSGPDSHKFMQGQFTCNLNDISPNQFRPGACCNAKGRMVSSFNLLQLGDGEYILSLHQSIAELTQNHLKKYMVFFKSQMQATDYLIAGITGSQAVEALGDFFENLPHNDYEQSQQNNTVIIKLPHNAGFQLYLPLDKAEDILSSLISKCTLSSNTQWNENLIHCGLGYVRDVTSEEFIPQMLNMSQQGGISFSKGCYTGQEIVARMQYLGKLKRHTYRLAVDPNTAISVGDEIFTEDKSSPVGTVVLSTQLDNQQQALVVLEDKVLPSIGNGSLFIGPNRAVVKELLSLPYDVIDAQPE